MTQNLIGRSEPLLLILLKQITQQIFQLLRKRLAILVFETFVMASPEDICSIFAEAYVVRVIFWCLLERNVSCNPDEKAHARSEQIRADWVVLFLAVFYLGAHEATSSKILGWILTFLKVVSKSKVWKF